MWNRIQPRLTLTENLTSRLSRPAYFRYTQGGIIYILPETATHHYTVAVKYLDIEADEPVTICVADTAAEARQWADRKSGENYNACNHDYASFCSNCLK